MLAGALEIEMLANLARLRKDMDQAKSIVAEAATGVQRSVDLARKALGLLGVGLSANYFANFVKGAIDAQDRLDELSQRTGLSVKSLAGLDFATKMTGTNLDVLVKGLKTVSTQMFDASRGSKTAMENFDSLGIEIYGLNGQLKTSDQLLLEAADKFAILTDETEMTALATKLFGKAGTELIPILKEGSAAIAAMIAEGQRLNPVTEESARLAGEFNDNVDKLSIAAAGLKQTLVNGLLPSLTELAKVSAEYVASDEFKETLELIAIAAEYLAAILVAKLILAITQQGLAAAAATVENMRYQAKLAQMAGVSTSAAIATGTLSAGMALLGGPAGVVAIAAISMYNLVQSLVDTEREMRTVITGVRDYIDAGNDMIAMRDRLASGKSLAEAATGEDAEAIQEVAGYVGELFKNMGLAAPAARTLTDEALDLEVAATAVGEAVYKWAENVVFTVDAHDAHIDALEDYLKTQETAAESARNAEKSVLDQIAALKNEQKSLSMTAREQHIFNEELKAMANNASPAYLAQIREIAGANFDTAESLRQATERAKDAQKATEDLARITEAAAERSAEGWDRFRESAGKAFADFREDGNNTIDAFLKSWKRMLDEMAGQLALSGVLKLFGVSLPGGSAGGMSGIMGSSGMAGTIAQTLFGGTFSGVAGSSSFVGPMVPGAAVGAGGAAGLGGYASALATNPATWAVAALMFAAENDFWKDPDGYKRSFAGMVTAPTPGAAGSTFSVDPFASGFKAQGIAHNVDRATAEKYIDVYRELDASVFELVQKLGGNVSLANATLGGVGMDGRFGTAGTFLGMGGKSTEDDLAAMVNSYLGQFLNHVTGLDDELMNAVRSAGSAEEAIGILSKAVEKHEDVTKEAAVVAEKLVQAEEKLLSERLDGINGMSTLLRNAVDLHRSIENEINSAMGASPLFRYEGQFSDQLAMIADQRDYIIRNHQEQMRAEQDLHNQRIGFARSFQDYTTALRLGDFSNFGSAGKFDFAQGNFRSLAASAQGGDLDALKRLQGAAEQYVTSADQMFASSGGRKSVVSEVLAIMDSLGTSLGASQFDPAAANDAMIEQLQALDQQLASIAFGINQSVIAELKNMNVTLSELSPKMQESLIGAIGQWVTSSSPTGLAMIQALSGIKAGIDVLPPDIAMYMSSTMGQMMQAMLAAGKSTAYIANQFTPGTITYSAANKAVNDLGFGNLEDYRTKDSEILDYIGSFQNAATDLNAIAQIAAAAKENNISADRLAGLTGYSREQILEAAAAAGVPMFARGGYHAGGMAIVGEQGPELAQFAGPTRIFSNADSRGMMAGSSAELGEIKSALVEIKNVLMADAQFSGAQRERSLKALSGIEAKMAAEKSRVGSGRYANAS